MKIKLVMRRKGTLLYEGIHNITDAESFGAACAAAWAGVEEGRKQKTTSIGELMETVSEDMLGELSGAEMHFEKV